MDFGMILTAGPSISQKEIDYVLDALQNGWNEKLSEYIDRFEQEFARFIGVKHAWTTSSGTGALHLALLGCGIGEGDEVIIPEVTFAACPNVVVYTGAKPVFADIEEDSWCLDPKSVLRRITPKTKAIMPVHMYGNVSDMDAINAIAKEHHLMVIEDACPSIGALYKGKRPGSLSHAAGFSFQGAKIMVTGQGGMMVTDDDEVFKRAQWLGSHGADGSIKFWHTAVGYKYYMSNIQAALGLAQLQRIDELVALKTQIFNWYKARLGNIEGLAMNTQPEKVTITYWMTSIVMKRDFGITRDELMGKMKERKIDTRPFFYPLSDFPHFEKTDNPMARQVAYNGINLPCGVNLTEEKVDYVCKVLRELLHI
ncbi:MAG: DegT/DnrJ/EryC1/StrS family aminotransferase [Candidatus Gracilibacteria bacterium]